MGRYDDVANIKAIKEETGAEKIFYLGWSQGTVQMFYALSTMEDEFFADNLYTFAALDPCTIDMTEGDRIYREGLFKFQDYGIYAFGGPNWDKDYNTICENFDEEICQYASDTYSDGGQPVSVKTMVHWAQNCLVNRFQEYVPDYTSDFVE